MTKSLARPPARGARRRPRGRPGRGRACSRSVARALIDVRERSEWEEGHIGGAAHVSRSYLEQQIEARRARPRPPSSCTARAAPAPLFAAADARRRWATRMSVSMSGGFQAVEVERPPVDRARRPVAGAEAALQPAPADPRGRCRGPGEAAGLEGAVHRRRGPRRARPAVPRRRGRGHHRHRRLRHRRCVQPPAPGHPHHRPRRRRKKTESAAESIRALNPDVTVVPHEEMLTEANVDRLIAGYDVMLDGTDTFETRYTLNDAAVRARIPVVHASVFRFEGQLTVFQPYEGPAIAASTPRRRRPSSRPAARSRACWASCPGIMGMLQAIGGHQAAAGHRRAARRAAAAATTRSMARSRSSSCGATRIARRAAIGRGARPAATSASTSRSC